MGAGVDGKWLCRFPQLGILLVWNLCVVLHSKAAGQIVKRVPDSVWAEQTVVSSFSTYTISSDGYTAIQANLTGSGCPMGNLSLVFPTATPSSRDIAVPGNMGRQCKTVNFLTEATADFQDIKPGTYRVRLQLGPAGRTVSFATAPGTDTQGNDSSSGTSLGIVRANTTLVTVVKAAVPGFRNQSSSTSRTRAAVTLTVGLDGPVQLPTSLGLHVWDDSAVEVEPKIQTWRIGESDARNFTLRLTRAAPSGQVVPWAELVRGENVLLKAISPPRLEIQAPRPQFRVAPDQVFYRDPTDLVSSSNGSSSVRNRGNSSDDGGGVLMLSTPDSISPRLGTVTVAVQRLSSSPFGSTLQYKATVLQATGCSFPACMAAVSGSGLLRFFPDNSSIPASLSVNWTALPAEATLGIRLQLTPIDNAELVDMPDNTTLLYIYGTTYGTCPAGTIGPWRELTLPVIVPVGTDGTLTQQKLSAATSMGPRSKNASASSSQLPTSSSPPVSGLWPPSPPKDLCNATVMLETVLGYDPTAAMLPVLSACAGGDVLPVHPTTAAPTPTGPPGSPSPSSSGVPGPQTATANAPTGTPQPQSTPAASDISAMPVEILVPYDQDAISLFLPLESTNATVVVLNTTCDLEPKLRHAAVRNPPSASGAAAAAAAWAELPLPTSLQICYVLLQVYGSVWSGQAMEQQQSQDLGDIPTDAAVPLSPAAPRSELFPLQSVVEAGNEASILQSGSSSAMSPSPAGEDNNTTASHSYPVSLSTSGPGPPAASTSPPPSVSNDGGVRLPILSMVLLRTFNVTVRPLSDPDIFSAGALSLYLLHRPSGRCLPLCGLPQPMLRAAAAQVFGDDFDAASQADMDAAAETLVLAIRGDPAASALLQAAVGTDGGSSGSGGASGSGRRRWLKAGKSLRRWLSGWLPVGPREVAAPVGDAAAAATNGNNIRGGQRARAGSAVGARRQLASTMSQRRIQQMSSTPPPAPTSAPGTALPSVMATHLPWAQPSSVDPAPASAPVSSPAGDSPSRPALTPPSWFTSTSLSQQPSPALQSATLPGPPTAPPVPPGSKPSNSAGPSQPAALPPPAAPLDGFDLAGGLGGNGSVHLLFNPKFVEWCHVSDGQVVDLALLTAPYDMELVASSLGLELQPGAAGGQREGPDSRTGEVAPAAVTLGPAMRLELLRQREYASASAGEDGGRLGNATTAPGAAANCSAPNPLLEADKNIAVLLVAPDGVSTVPLDLRLFADYQAAEVAAWAAAQKCQNSSRSSSTGENGTSSGNSTSASGTGDNAINAGANNVTGSGSAGGNRTSSPTPSNSSAVAIAAPVPPPAPPTSQGPGSISHSSVYMALPGLAPIAAWSACQPCGPGSFSNTTNATVCQICSPGSASNGTHNKECAPCAPGTFTMQTGSSSCRPCYAGSYAPRSGSTVCTVCPLGTTSLMDGARECVVPPQPSKGDTALVVSFQVLLISAGTSSAEQAARATGMSDASADSIFRMLIAADTAAALRIPPTMVRVRLMEVSPSTFLVNVSATMPFTQGPSSGTSTGAGSGGFPAGTPGDSPEMDADTLINRLVDNPDDSFPRTKEATGGSLQVQYVQRQVVVLDEGAGGVNPHVVIWPTLAGTGLLVVLLGLLLRRCCRWRRARLGLSLPPISDALGRLCTWKQPTSPQPVAYFGYGRFLTTELQELPSGLTATTRHRPGRSSSKSNLPVLALTLGSGSSDTLNNTNTATDLDVIAMYTREALAAARI